jgi:hypothetical protein
LKLETNETISDNEIKALIRSALKKSVTSIYLATSDWSADLSLDSFTTRIRQKEADLRNSGSLLIHPERKNDNEFLSFYTTKKLGERRSAPISRGSIFDV